MVGLYQWRPWGRPTLADVTADADGSAAANSFSVPVVGVLRRLAPQVGQVLGTVDVPTNRKFETNVSG